MVRTGFVAGEITRHGGITICALIASYAESRRQVRKRIAGLCGFMEVYLATPLAVCEQRDIQGNYAEAQAGDIQNFTGFANPYEVPETPEPRLDLTNLAPQDAPAEVIAYLVQSGCLPEAAPRKKSLP